MAQHFSLSPKFNNLGLLVYDTESTFTLIIVISLHRVLQDVQRTEKGEGKDNTECNSGWSGTRLNQHKILAKIQISKKSKQTTMKPQDEPYRNPYSNRFPSAVRS